MKLKWPLGCLTSIFVLGTCFFGGVEPHFLSVYPYLGLALFWITAATHKDNPLSIHHFEAVALGGILIVFMIQTFPFALKTLGTISPFALKTLVPDLFSGPFSATISQDPLLTFEALGLFMAGTCIYFSSKLIFQDKKNIQTFLKTSVLFASLLAAFGTLHKLSGSEKMFFLAHKGFIFFASFINKNHAASFFALFAILTLLLRKKHAPKALYSFAWFTLTTAVFFTGSRTGFLVFLISHLGYYFAFKPFKTLAPSHKAALFITFLIATGLFFKGAPIWNRLSQTTQGAIPHEPLRFSFWLMALKTFFQSIPFGIGFGTFEKISPFFIAPQAWVHPQHVENDYLEILCTGGFVTLVALTPLCIFLFHRIKSNLQTYRNSNTTLCLSVGLISLGIASLFIFQLPLPTFQMLFLILLGALISQTNSTEGVFLGKFFTPPPLLLFICFSFVLGGVLFFKQKEQKYILRKDWIEKNLRFFSSQTSRPLYAKALSLQSEGLEQELSSSLQKSPRQFSAFYLQSVLFANQNKSIQASKAFEHASAWDPFSINLTMIAAKGIARVAPEQTEKTLRRILSSPQKLSASLSDWAVTQLCELNLKNNEAFECSSKLLEYPLLPWKKDLIRSFFHDSDPTQLRDAFALCKNHELKDFDEIFFRFLPFEKNFKNLEEKIKRLAPHRKDLGLWLKKIKTVHPTLDPRISLPLTTLKGLNAVSPEDFEFSPPMLNVHLSRISADPQGIFVPLDFFAKHLHFFLRVKSTLKPRTKVFFLAKANVFVPPQTWMNPNPDHYELLLSPDFIPGLEMLEGIGFLMQRNESYSIENIEIFVK